MLVYPLLSDRYRSAAIIADNVCPRFTVAVVIILIRRFALFLQQTMGLARRRCDITFQLIRYP